MKNQRILVIAQDDKLASQLKKTLVEADYRVWRARDGTDGLKKLYRASPDLVVLESALSITSREDPCLRIRQASYIPILVVGGGQDAAEVLERGADAYIARPPDMRELAARVKALLRRKHTGETVA